MEGRHSSAPRSGPQLVVSRRYKIDASMSREEPGFDAEERESVAKVE